MFTVVRVDQQLAEVIEPLGTKRKFWFNDDQGRRILFKAEERGTGEDWAEKLACEFCRLLGLPHVEYQLAEEVRTKTPGVVCETFTPSPWALVLGNQALLVRDPDYPGAEGRKYKVREHAVDAVAEVVSGWELPPPAFAGNLPHGVETALDVFIGYVMLDAWIANQDRHHENWAAIRDGDRLLLAPTFDHGASLARNLTDEERDERMTTRDANRQIPEFVRKARSAFYGQATDAKPLLTFDAWRAFASRGRVAASAWLERLRSIDDNDVNKLMAEVPPARMTKICREFTLRLLTENQRRLLEGRFDE
jgi:hypothetical protein